jgi:hypothetical protein
MRKTLNDVLFKPRYMLENPKYLNTYYLTGAGQPIYKIKTSRRRRKDV